MFPGMSKSEISSNAKVKQCLWHIPESPAACSFLQIMMTFPGSLMSFVQGYALSQVPEREGSRERFTPVD